MAGRFARVLVVALGVLVAGCGPDGEVVVHGPRADGGRDAADVARPDAVDVAHADAADAGVCDAATFDAAAAPIRVTPSTTPRTAGRNSLAFDTQNRVYLSIQAGSPVSGLFLSEDGRPAGDAFAIVPPDEASFTGWPTVSFGGPPSDPTFLVTYLTVEGDAHRKYARLVRYHAGAAPSVSPRSLIADVLGEWFAAEKAQSIWDGTQFVVATRVGGGTYPQPWLHHVDTNGAVSAGQSLGDGMDFEGSPALACGAGGVCLATGFAGGVPFGAQGVIFGRLFDAATLRPLGPLFYLDDHSSRMDDPTVVFDASAGQFTVAWWQAQYAAFRTVRPDGTLGALGRRFGPGAGDIVLSYNAATQTTLLVTKWSPPPDNTGADLYAVELRAGLEPGAPVLLTQWDGRWPEYTPAVAVDEAHARWFVLAVESDGGRAALVQGTAAPRGCAP